MPKISDSADSLTHCSLLGLMIIIIRTFCDLVKQELKVQNVFRWSKLEVKDSAVRPKTLTLFRFDAKFSFRSGSIRKMDCSHLPRSIRNANFPSGDLALHRPHAPVIVKNSRYYN